VVVALGGAINICRADDVADARNTARSFVQALAKGDADGAKACLAPGVADADTGKFIDALAAMMLGRTKLDDAAVAKFGDQAKPPADPGLAMVAQIDKADGAVDGDTVVLSHPKDPNPLKLRKVEGAWKIIEVGNAQELQKALPRLQAATKAELETAQETSDGKYKSFVEARMALVNKLRALATAPSEPPAPAPAH